MSSSYSEDDKGPGAIPKPRISRLKNVINYYESKYDKHEKKRILDNHKWSQEQAYYGSIIYDILKPNKEYKNHLKKIIDALVTLNEKDYLELLIKDDQSLFKEIDSIEDAIHAKLYKKTQKYKIKKQH